MLSSPTPAAAGLLGLGPGLTRSRDDLLCGMLVTLHKLGGRTSASGPWRVLEAHLATATHAISAAHLRAAARHACAEALDRVVDALIRGDASALQRAWPVLVARASPSAGDALAAAATTLRAVLARFERSEQIAVCS